MEPLPESPTSILVSPPKKQTLDLFSVFKRQPHGERFLGFSYLEGLCIVRKDFYYSCTLKGLGDPYGIN